MGNAPHRFITFNFFVSTNGEEDALPGFKEDHAFRLGYDERTKCRYSVVREIKKQKYIY